MIGPIAPAGKTCPFHNKDVSKCCHTCALYTLVRGKNPATGADVDEWGCSLAFLPMIGLEGARMARSAAAATESLRNEVVKGNGRRNSELLASLTTAAPNNMKLLSGERKLEGECSVD